MAHLRGTGCPWAGDPAALPPRGTATCFRYSPVRLCCLFSFLQVLHLGGQQFIETPSVACALFPVGGRTLVCTALALASCGCGGGGGCVWGGGGFAGAGEPSWAGYIVTLKSSVPTESF